MPLPAALAARLAKRGIVKEFKKTEQKPPEEVEEVFAEDYDEPGKTEVDEGGEVGVKRDEEYTVTGVLPISSEPLLHPSIHCPNKINPYHQCTHYCKNRYGLKEFKPQSAMLRKRDRHLRKYPLPEGWQEVADPETCRYYYWNLVTDQVCWLSPTHPLAHVTLPADKLQAVLGKTGSLVDMDEHSDEEEMDAELVMSEESSSEEEEEKKDHRRQRDRRHDQDRDRDRDRDKDRSRERGRRRRDDRKGRDTLDPMDPAAYSDIPRGGWSEGLDQRGKAKTGVDVTASGPLFQQRPYPSPGDVLRANRAMTDKPADA